MTEAQAKYPEHVIEGIKLVMDAVELPLTERQREATERFIALNVLDNGLNKPVSIHDEEARLSITNGDADFLYDRTSGLVFFHLESSHVFVAASLQAVYTQRHESMDEFQRHNRGNRVRSDLADEYVEQGRGLIFSSVMVGMGKRKLTLSEDAPLTREEKMIFAGYDFDYI